MNKAIEVISLMDSLKEDLSDDHISFLKNHPQIPDSIKRKLDLLKREKANLEKQHDEYYAHWVQSGDEEAKSMIDAIDQKLNHFAEYIKTLVDEHAGLKA